MHESDNLCRINTMFEELFIELAGLSCTQIYK